MKDYIKHHEWDIIEDQFRPEFNLISESLCSIGNGRMGQRANFEEQYSGETLQGSYLAGVYYPDPTRVGWWKNGYPEYYAKVLNAPNWIGIDIEVNGVSLDLAKARVLDFQRVLHMKEGFLERSFKARLSNGNEVAVNSKRFCSIVDDEVGAIRYELKVLNFDGQLEITPYIDADVINQDANYGEKFWNEVDRGTRSHETWVTAETKKLGFEACVGMKFDIEQNGKNLNFEPETIFREKYAANRVVVEVSEGDTVVIYKYAACVTSENYPKNELLEICQGATKNARVKGFDKLLTEQKNAWSAKWQQSDISIEGDVAAQQGIRFNIFHLHQTYTGEDERLNIGPKGFTGEKYGGSTYWDTEAYCLPFFLSTSEQRVSRNLLIYRYRHLEKAIENASKLGFSDGAALYPMVTMNGEECHNEWEITFEEIHRNGAIAYAIYQYIRYTGDKEYLVDYGLEVLIAISRFWAQRVNFSEDKQKYVMLGVTGPNEYENNVNNNWYTNRIACWVMTYTQEAIEYVKAQAPETFEQLVATTSFDEQKEVRQWQEIIANMHYPVDEERGVFLQQDGYLDKALLPVSELDPKHLPITQNWSWDRILRSCFIKQADVLQGLYFLEEEYDVDTIRRNFDFYEPMTVHESSLSPCVHAILAARLGYQERAYELYLRTARLDLDDYNNDTEDGLHITSMAGTWMSVVRGFAALKVKDDVLYLSPFIPSQWKNYSFRIGFRKAIIKVKVSADQVDVLNSWDQSVSLKIYGNTHEIEANQSISVANEMQGVQS